MKNRSLPQYLIIAFFSTAILACASQKSGDSNDAESTESTMEVALNLTMTSNYCGGAAPSDDILNKLKEPKKFSNQKVLLSNKKSLQDDMQEVMTSSNGTISTSLAKGTYYVFLPEKKSAKYSRKDNSEESCIKWKNTPNGSFTVGDDKNISFNIHKTCDSCGPIRM